MLEVDVEELRLNQPSIVNEVNDPPNKVLGTDNIPVEAEHGPFFSINFNSYLLGGYSSIDKGCLYQRQ